MEALRERATRKRWADEKDFLPLTSGAYRTPPAGVDVRLDASIEDVEAVLTRALKPERELIKVFRFSSGKVKELGPPPPPPPPKEDALATTVARPVNGCPMPSFPETEKIDARAAAVLERFLDPTQTKDFRSEGMFMTRGADTGRRYLVCHREKPRVMARSLSFRQLFDVDQKMALCVHDWAVPPAEEMLALHLCLTLPGRETELLRLPEMPAALAMQAVDPRYRPMGF